MVSYDNWPPLDSLKLGSSVIRKCVRLQWSDRTTQMLKVLVKGKFLMEDFAFEPDQQINNMARPQVNSAGGQIMARQTPSPMKMPPLPPQPQQQQTQQQQLMALNSQQQQQHTQQQQSQIQFSQQQIAMNKAEIERSNAFQDSIATLSANTSGSPMQMQNHIQNQVDHSRSLEQQISQSQINQMNQAKFSQAQMNQTVTSVANHLQLGSPMGRQSPSKGQNTNRTPDTKDMDVKPSPPRNGPTPPQFSQANKAQQSPFQSGMKSEDVKMQPMTSQKEVQNQIKEEKPNLLHVSDEFDSAL